MLKKGAAIRPGCKGAPSRIGFGAEAQSCNRERTAWEWERNVKQLAWVNMIQALVLGALVAALLLCTPVRASDTNFTPLPGSPLRKALLDALRQDIKRMHGLDVVFVVRHLKVKDGWAWAHTQPQSPDGVNRYEDVSALLELRNGAWTVAEIPCCEVENPDCLNGPEYFVGLRARFPRVPTEIFPDWATKCFDQSPCD